MILFVSTACMATRNVVDNQPKMQIENLIINGSFTNGKEYWNPWQNANKYSNLVTLFEKGLYEMRADESCSACYQIMHFYESRGTQYIV